MWKKTAQTARSASPTLDTGGAGASAFGSVPVSVPAASSSSSFFSAAGSGHGSWSGVTIVLELLLWYFNFIHPIYVGSQICKKVSIKLGDLSATYSTNALTPLSSREIPNCVLAFAMLWLLELSDQLILRELIAMRNVYLLARILFCTYLLHPRFRGALHIYQTFGIEGLIERHGWAVDDFLVSNVSFLKHQGAVEFVIKGFKFVLGWASEIAYIIKQLLIPAGSEESRSLNASRRGSFSVSDTAGRPPPVSIPSLPTDAISPYDNYDSGTPAVPSAAALSSRAARAANNSNTDTPRGGERSDKASKTPRQTSAASSRSPARSNTAAPSVASAQPSPSKQHDHADGKASSPSATPRGIDAAQHAFNAMLSAMNKDARTDDDHQAGYRGLPVDHGDSDADLTDLVGSIAAKRSAAYPSPPPSYPPPPMGTLRSGTTSTTFRSAVGSTLGQGAGAGGSVAAAVMTATLMTARSQRHEGDGGTVNGVTAKGLSTAMFSAGSSTVQSNGLASTNPYGDDGDEFSPDEDSFL